MEKKFKYADLIKDFANCPPATGKEIDSNIYRYVFEDINNENNFKPVLLIQPKRINSEQFDQDQMKCLGYALSVYDSFVNAKLAFENMLRRFKNFPKIVGEHVAEIKVVEDDGFATEIARSGHFDFFEYDKIDLKSKISNLEKIVL